MPGNFLLMWTFQPPVYIGIALAAILYAWFVRASNRRVQAAGGDLSKLAKPFWFYLGLAVLFVTLESPLDEIGELFLFWVHMIQHMLLGFVIAPLLLMGLRNRFPAVPGWVLGPMRAIRAQLPNPTLLRRLGAYVCALAWRLLKILTQPIVAIIFFNGIFSAYHIPAVYQAGLADVNIHALEHLTLLFAGMITFWPIVSPLPELPALSAPARMVYVFLDGLGMTPIFAGVTFSTHIIYPWYAHAPRIMSFTPLEDQQMGGIVMKLMGGAVYLTALFQAFYEWCRSDMDVKGPRFLGDEADASLILEERAHAARRSSLGHVPVARGEGAHK